jgi:type I restriction enzyme, S subunit
MKWTFINNSQDKITSAAIEGSSTKLIKSGAVLSVVRSGILKNTWPLAINTVDVTLNQDMKALICSERINNYFLLYYLKNYSRKILGSVRGTTADNISTSVFKKIPIKLPEIEKQLRFRDIVKSIEKEKTVTNVEKTEELFSSLVQGVFG